MAVLVIASLFGSAFALIYEHTEDTYVGGYTTAWAGITEYLNPSTLIVVQAIFAHNAWSGGNLGSWSTFMRQDFNWYEYNAQGQWIGSASETETRPSGGGPVDADAYASLFV